MKDYKDETKDFKAVQLHSVGNGFFFLFTWFPSYFYMFDFKDALNNSQGKAKITLSHFYHKLGYGIMTNSLGPDSFVTATSLSPEKTSQREILVYQIKEGKAEVKTTIVFDMHMVWGIAYSPARQ